MRKVLAFFVLLQLSACGIGPYDIEVLCEKREGDIAVQVVRYARYSMTLLPGLGGKDVFAGIRVVNDSFFGLDTWIGETYLPIEYFSLAPEVCRRSDIDGENIAIVPITGHENLTRHVVWNRSNYRGRDENVLVLHSSSSSLWTVRGAPDFGPPNLMDEQGQVLTSLDWQTAKVQVDGSRIVASQQKALRQPFLDFYARIYGPIKSDHTLYYNTLDYVYGNPTREGCPECEPVLWRTMVSDDFAVTWSLKDYGVLRPEVLTDGVVLVATEEEESR